MTTVSVLHLPTPDLGGMPTQNTSVSNDAHPANSANTATSTANVKPGLPSPSNSETSDYQRSTPSPSNGNEEQLRSLGEY